MTVCHKCGGRDLLVQASSLEMSSVVIGVDVCVCAPRDLKRLINSESFKEALRKALGE
jgi:hypothetical protein